MKQLVLWLIFLVLCPCAAFPQGQVAPPRPQKRIVTKTRLVAIFSDLENQLFQAAQSKDHAGLDAILAEDFQLWPPTPPGDPVPREDWLSQSLAENLRDFRVRQMAAHSVAENVTVVSFVLSKTVARAGKTSVQNYFVVDLWQKVEDKWKLSDRYASPLSGATLRANRPKPSGKN
jgi:ketosteroid isomerase-like protein